MFAQAPRATSSSCVTMTGTSIASDIASILAEDDAKPVVQVDTKRSSPTKHSDVAVLWLSEHGVYEYQFLTENKFTPAEKRIQFQKAGALAREKRGNSQYKLANSKWCYVRFIGQCCLIVSVDCGT